MNFNEKIKSKCFEKNNRLCLGLDVDNNLLENTSLDYMNSYIEDIINATIDLCPIYKVNFSFYERYGSKGYKILEKIPEYINNRAISIADAKPNASAPPWLLTTMPFKPKNKAPFLFLGSSLSFKAASFFDKSKKEIFPKKELSKIFLI